MKHTERLLEIMEQLRNKKQGCPWDVKQDFSSLTPYIIEEAYELVDAIQRADEEDIKEEMGDYLLQIVFLAQIAKEEQRFDFETVASVINEKLIRRHPHIFNGNYHSISEEEQKKLWEQIKAEEKSKKSTKQHTSILDDVPVNHTGLTRASKLQKKASKVGFDWDKPAKIFDKFREEIAEFHEAIEQKDPDNMEEELGDILFTLAHIANRYEIDPEQALRRANNKFYTRFNQMEQRITQEGYDINKISLAKWEEMWLDVKANKT